MAQALFQKYSWHSSWRNALQLADRDVVGLDRRLFSDPAALAAALKEIVDKYSVEVARLDTDPNSITAVPVEESRYVNDYGMRRQVTVKRLQVSIPFTGEADSFNFAPSSSAVVMQPVEVGRDSLAIMVADDNNADQEIRTFCTQVQGNLDTLRREYERDKPQLEQVVSQAAERRKAEISAENERDSKRSFTVRR